MNESPVDSQPFPKTRTVVLGLGNLVHADDGVGVHAIHRLQQDPRVPPHVTLMDGGTMGIALLAHLAGTRRLIVVDAVDVGEPPGSIIRVEGPDLSGLPGKPSVHQLGFADLLITMQLLGEPPDEIVLLGVQPESTAWSADLTPKVEAALAPLADAVLQQLEQWA